MCVCVCVCVGYYAGSRSEYCFSRLTYFVSSGGRDKIRHLCNKLFIIQQITQVNNEFSTVYSAAFNRALTALTQLVNQWLTRVISSYICTLKTHICTRYLVRVIITHTVPFDCVCACVCVCPFLMHTYAYTLTVRVYV